jgi:hypothetical protein
MTDKNPESMSFSSLHPVVTALLIAACIGIYLLVKHLGLWGIVRPVVIRKKE